MSILHEIIEFSQNSSSVSFPENWKHEDPEQNSCVYRKYPQSQHHKQPIRPDSHKIQPLPNTYIVKVLKPIYQNNIFWLFRKNAKHVVFQGDIISSHTRGASPSSGWNRKDWISFHQQLFCRAFFRQTLTTLIPNSTK
jgi:hypothetical protein